MSTEERTIKLGQILEREFRAALDLPIASRVSVAFGEDETITITADGDPWVMEIGSDDDGFDFWVVDPSPGQRDRITFDFPTDWLDIADAE